VASPFVHRFVSAGQYFVYDVNTNGVFHVDKTFYDLIERVEWTPTPPGSSTPLNPVLRAISVAEASERQASEMLSAIDDYHTRYGAFSARRSRGIRFPIDPGDLPRVYSGFVQQLILCVTEQCNLRCAYCAYSGTYQYNRAHSLTTMTAETALRGVDFLMEHSKYILASAEDTVTLSFYGGEPLLNHALISECIRHLESRYPLRRERVSLSLTTNLTTATSSILQHLVDNEVQLNVSLDGPAQIHDRYRTSQSGHGSSAKVRGNLEWLRDNAPEFYKTHVSFTAVLAPPYQISQIVEFFETDDLVQGHVVTLNSVSPNDTTFLLRFGAEQGDAWMTQLTEQRRRFVRSVAAHDYTSHGPLNSLFGRRILDVAYRPAVLLPDAIYPGSICLPGCQRTFVSPSGALHMCEKIGERLPIGDLESGYDHERIAVLINQFEQLGKEECTSCWACRFCGNCFTTALHGNHLDRERMLQSCNSIKSGLTEALEDYAELMLTAPADVWSRIHLARKSSAAARACRFIQESVQDADEMIMLDASRTPVPRS
jgi:uncharacterized protein